MSTRRHRVARALQQVMLLSLAWIGLSAHVGTTQVVLEGNAGPYPIRVFIRPPGVVPAQVPIVVHVFGAAPSRVTLRAAQWNLGTRGAPAAEDAMPVPGDSGTYAHDLWIMTSSSYAIHVHVEGALGSGTLLVPMQSVATKTLSMSPAIGGILIFLGTLLVIGVLTLVGAATREGSLEPGEIPDASRKRAGRVAMASAAAVLAVALVGGSRWWNSEEAAYRRGLYRPYKVHTVVRVSGASRVLTLAITDSLWVSRRQVPLLPDHGKLMHLFLVKVDERATVAHLHPLRTAVDTFTTTLPPMLPGRYFLFADVVHQSGYQRTLVDTIEVPLSPPPDLKTDNRARIESAVWPVTDADDAWRASVPASVGDSARLPGGGSATLTLDGVAQSNHDMRLRVAVHNADGTAASLEPYMGMQGHAMVMRADGRVFMHLHPMGSASLAAQAQLIRRERGDTARLDSASMAAAMAAAESGADATMGGMHGYIGDLSFPLSFPEPGVYYVFVQTKRRGVVETTSFTVSVAR